MSCSFQSVNSYWSKWLCYVCCRKPQNKTWNGHWRCLIWFDSTRRLSWNYKIQNLQFKLKKYRLSEENNANKHSEMLDAYLQGIFRPYVQHREEKMTNKQNKHSFFKAHKLWKVRAPRSRDPHNLSRVRRGPAHQTVRESEQESESKVWFNGIQTDDFSHTRVFNPHVWVDHSWLRVAVKWLVEFRRSW